MADDTLLREVAGRGAAAQERTGLQRLDWLRAALEIFVAEGIEAVRITRLADTLEVTRGSFYWHFANRDDLIDALVAYWRDKNTRAVVDAVEGADTLSDGILRLFEAWLDPAAFDARLDLAIREWARRSEAIREEMRAADDARIDALTELYRRFGYAMPEALIRARVIYFAQIGFYALDVEEPMATRVAYTAAYFEAYTGKRIARKAADDFGRRILERFGDGS